MVCRGFRACHSQNVRRQGCNKCLTATDESNPTVKENQVSYTVKNNNRLTALKYLIDGGVIDGTEEKRCDYLMMFSQRKQAFFVELKTNGGDWKEAVKQLENTVKLLLPEMPGYTPHLRAVVKRKVPNTKYIGPELAKMFPKIISSCPGATLKVGWQFNDNVD